MPSRTCGYEDLDAYRNSLENWYKAFRFQACIGYEKVRVTVHSNGKGKRTSIKYQRAYKYLLLANLNTGSPEASLNQSTIETESLESLGCISHGRVAICPATP